MILACNLLQVKELTSTIDMSLNNTMTILILQKNPPLQGDRD